MFSRPLLNWVVLLPSHKLSSLVPSVSPELSGITPSVSPEMNGTAPSVSPELGPSVSHQLNGTAPSVSPELGRIAPSVSHELSSLVPLVSPELSVSLDKMSGNPPIAFPEPNDVALSVSPELGFTSSSVSRKLSGIAPFSDRLPALGSFTSPQKSAKSDWSRSTRNRLALLKAGSDSRQCKITSFFEALMSTVNRDPSLKEVIENEYQHQQPCSNFRNFSCMLKALLHNAEKNTPKTNQSIRHDMVIKKFASSLLIFCGPMAYNFIQKNMDAALPSLRTVQRLFHKDHRPFIEGEFRFDDLLVHLNKYEAVRLVSVSEDATRLIARVEYDNDSDKLVGFVLPCDSNGLPLCDTFRQGVLKLLKKLS